jgi:hypothetical protein
MSENIDIKEIFKTILYEYKYWNNKKKEILSLISSSDMCEKDFYNMCYQDINKYFNHGEQLNYYEIEKICNLFNYSEFYELSEEDKNKIKSLKEILNTNNFILKYSRYHIFPHVYRILRSFLD